MTTAAIEVQTLRKDYTEGLFNRKSIQALQGVSFTVNRGEIFGLLGPNGAGKTTLIKILLGIVRKSAGQAKVLGETAGSRSVRKRIGYLPENHRIPRHLTGNTALEFYGALSGMSGSQIRKRRPQLLELVGLERWGTTNVGKYSKGMQQRLGLAQAMLHDPELIILDEPTDGVDPVGRAEIRLVLKHLKTEGKTIFLNSHLLQEVELVSDRVAIMDHGQLKRVAGVGELTHDEREMAFQLAGSVDEITLATADYEVIHLQPNSTGLIQLTVRVSEPEQIDALIDRLRHHHIGIREIQKRRSSLEEAFIKIIQEGARES